MTYCSWIDNEGMCGRSADIKFNLALCGLHRNTITVTNQMKAAYTAVKALDCDRSESVYFVNLPTGNIKIGVSKNLPQRLKDLHRAFGGRLELLASTTGGYEYEARLHHQFRDYRVTELLGEQFIPNTELDELILRTGIDAVGMAAATIYDIYEPKTFTTNPAYLPLTPTAYRDPSLSRPLSLVA